MDDEIGVVVVIIIIIIIIDAITVIASVAIGATAGDCLWDQIKVLLLLQLLLLMADNLICPGDLTELHWSGRVEGIVDHVAVLLQLVIVLGHKVTVLGALVLALTVAHVDVLAQIVSLHLLLTLVTGEVRVRMVVLQVHSRASSAKRGKSSS